MIALDTNVVIDLIRVNDTVRGRYDEMLRTHEPMIISVFVLQELLFGAELHPHPDQERLRLAPILRDLEVVAFELADAEIGGVARAQMERQGRRSPTGDFIVGAHALARGATLVTANTRHFEHIPGLMLVNWRLPPEEQDAFHA